MNNVSEHPRLTLALFAFSEHSAGSNLPIVGIDR